MPFWITPSIFQIEYKSVKIHETFNASSEKRRTHFGYMFSCGVIFEIVTNVLHVFMYVKVVFTYMNFVVIDYATFLLRQRKTRIFILNNNAYLK